MKQQRHEAGGGFTLIELLVIVTILGILSAVTVAALGTFGSAQADAACATDLKTLTHAESTALAATGSYLDSGTLLSGGFLRDQIDSYTAKNATATSYDVVAHGRCGPK